MRGGRRIRRLHHLRSRRSRRIRWLHHLRNGGASWSPWPAKFVAQIEQERQPSEFGQRRQLFQRQDGRTDESESLSRLQFLGADLRMALMSEQSTLPPVASEASLH